MSSLGSLRSVSGTKGGRGLRIKDESDLEFVADGLLLEIESEPTFCHWAVYLGKGKVSHFTLPRGEGGSSGTLMDMLDGIGTVRTERYTDMMRGSSKPVYVNSYYDGLWTPQPVDKILDTAKKLNGLCFKYSVENSNCEHYATLCRFNKTKSKQGEIAENVLSIIGVEDASDLVGTVRSVSGR